MSGAQQITFMNQRSFGAPELVIGAAYEGGFYAGQISTTADGVATHNLVVGPMSTAHIYPTQYKDALTAVGGGGAGSVIDGPLNTSRMVADGNSTTYPAAHFCNNLVIGGYSDWYMPAINEYQVCYFNLKPTTTSNTTSSGINANAVPARASNYTAGNPAQTAAAAFQSGGSEAFVNSSHWSSTENSATQVRLFSFQDGAQFSANRWYSSHVRAVRRVAV